MTVADVLILLILVGSTLIGALRGFIREAVSVAFWILAIWGAWRFGPAIEPHLGGLLADPNIAPWVGRLVILVLVGLMVIGGELLHLNQEDWWGRSKLIPYGETVGDWLRAMVGEKGDPWTRLERLTGAKFRPK